MTKPLTTAKGALEAAACRRVGYNPGIAQVNLIVSPEEVPHA